MNQIAKNLRLLRLQTDKKQDELAELLGISQQEYSKFERGITTPHVKHLNVFASIYQVTIDQLLHANLPDLKNNHSNNNQSLTMNERELYEKLLEAKDAQIKIQEAVSALKIPKGKA